MSIDPWDCYVGKLVWYRPGFDGKRYSATIASDPRKLGETNVVRLSDVEEAYGIECHGGEKRTTLAAAALSNIDARDLVDELCTLVREAGLTMTLHGVPVTADELKAHATENVEKRIADLLTRKA